MKGWHGDPLKHSLAARGIRTKVPQEPLMANQISTINSIIEIGAKENLRFREMADFYRVQDDFIGTKDKKLFVSYLKLIISSSGLPGSQELVKKLPKEIPVSIAEQKISKMGINPNVFRKVNRVLFPSQDVDLLKSLAKIDEDIKLKDIEPINVKVGFQKAILGNPTIKGLVKFNVPLKDYVEVQRATARLDDPEFLENFGRVWAAGLQGKPKVKKDFLDAQIDFNDAKKFLENEGFDPDAVRKSAPALHSNTPISMILEEGIELKAMEGKERKKQRKKERTEDLFGEAKAEKKRKTLERRKQRSEEKAEKIAQKKAEEREKREQVAKVERELKKKAKAEESKLKETQRKLESQERKAEQAKRKSELSKITKVEREIKSIEKKIENRTDKVGDTPKEQRKIDSEVKSLRRQLEGKKERLTEVQSQVGVV